MNDGLCCDMLCHIKKRGVERGVVRVYIALRVAEEEKMPQKLNAAFF